MKKPGKEEEVFKVASSDDEGFMMRRRRRKVVRRKKGDLRGRGRKGVGNDDEGESGWGDVFVVGLREGMGW